MDWYPYDRELRQERIKKERKIFIPLLFDHFLSAPLPFWPPQLYDEFPIVL